MSPDLNNGNIYHISNTWAYFSDFVSCPLIATYLLGS